MAYSDCSYIRLVQTDEPAPNRIRELREEKGLSQVELARRIHCSPPALQKVEVGTRKLDQEWMRRIARALSISSAELLPMAENPWALSREEKALIEKYRKAGAENRARLHRMAAAVLDWDSADDEAA